MIDLINNIKKTTFDLQSQTILKNESLQININCFSVLCAKEIKEFSHAFNNLFKYNKTNENYINVYIYENKNLFEQALDKLQDKTLINSIATTNFNKATINTSISKCTYDKNYYILKCYEYFIYIFDKKNKDCYMLIKNNKKSITMINILLLTPYLMYGELYAVHGGLVNKESNNILINNSSLGGKTTFAILFAANNWNIITEETTYITKQGKILPYNIRNYFNIRVGTYLNFKDFFISKNLINDKFLDMQFQNNKVLFDMGKDNQYTVEFDKIGTYTNLENNYITHSLKVSINKKQSFKIEKCSSTEIVNAFLDLSLSPTVLLFTELLNYNKINKTNREKELHDILKNTKSFIVNSDLSYKEKFDYISEFIKV